jgi:hypothetical protein
VFEEHGWETTLAMPQMEKSNIEHFKARMTQRFKIVSKEYVCIAEFKFFYVSIILIANNIKFSISSVSLLSHSHLQIDYIVDELYPNEPQVVAALDQIEDLFEQIALVQKSIDNAHVRLNTSVTRKGEAEAEREAASHAR